MKRRTFTNTDPLDKMVMAEAKRLGVKFSEMVRIIFRFYFDNITSQKGE